MAKSNLSKLTKIHPELNLRAEDFYRDDPGGVEDPCIDDGEHIILECQRCRVALADIWKTRPDNVLSTKIKATCCYCGGESQKIEFKGGFHLGATDKCVVRDVVNEDVEYIATNIVSQTVTVITSRS
jgi:hypothetical protein